MEKDEHGNLIREITGVGKIFDLNLKVVLLSLNLEMMYLNIVYHLLIQLMWKVYNNLVLTYPQMV